MVGEGYKSFSFPKNIVFNVVAIAYKCRPNSNNNLLKIFSHPLPRESSTAYAKILRIKLNFYRRIFF